MNTFSLGGLLCVVSGAGLGATLRWLLSAWNPLLPNLPLGTLAANLIGGFLVGVAAAYLSVKTNLPSEVRLLVVTGFLGGLTTFSSFSSEVVGLLERSEFAWAGMTASLHLFGSLALTALGLLITRWALQIA